MATTHIPIVFSGVGDPIGLGLIQSFARPGGNITGVTDLGLELGPKRLEVFQEIVPGLKRVLYLYAAMRPTPRQRRKCIVTRPAASGWSWWSSWCAPRRKPRLRSPRCARTRWMGSSCRFTRSPLNIPGLILEAASQQGIPTMFRSSFLVERGGLASYGPDGIAWPAGGAPGGQDPQGGKPAVIPVEMNSKVETDDQSEGGKGLGDHHPPGKCCSGPIGYPLTLACMCCKKAWGLEAVRSPASTGGWLCRICQMRSIPQGERRCVMQSCVRA